MLKKCSRNDQHEYSDHLSACPWCERKDQLGGNDPFPSTQAIKAGQYRSGVSQTPLPPLAKSPVSKTAMAHPLPKQANTTQVNAAPIRVASAPIRNSQTHSTTNKSITPAIIWLAVLGIAAFIWTGVATRTGPTALPISSYQPTSPIRSVPSPDGGGGMDGPENAPHHVSDKTFNGERTLASSKLVRKHQEQKPTNAVVSHRDIQISRSSSQHGAAIDDLHDPSTLERHTKQHSTTADGNGSLHDDNDNLDSNKASSEPFSRKQRTISSDNTNSDEASGSDSLH